MSAHVAWQDGVGAGAYNRIWRRNVCTQMLFDPSATHLYVSLGPFSTFELGSSALRNKPGVLPI